MRFLISAPLLLFGLCACVTPRVAGQERDFDDAVAAPLYDINVVRTKIPVVLLEARDRPYQVPVPVTCGEIRSLVVSLNEALGPDLDVPPDDNDPSLLARSGQAAQGAAVSVVEGAAESLIPMRSWVRRLSGAERHDRQVQEAITAGGVRRAFLKGLGQQLNCPPPAAPSAAAAAGQVIDPQPPARWGPRYPVR